MHSTPNLLNGLQEIQLHLLHSRLPTNRLYRFSIKILRPVDQLILSLQKNRDNSQQVFNHQCSKRLFSFGILL